MEGPASPERQEIDSDREEVVASGNFHGRGTSSTSRPVVPIASSQPSSGRPSITPAQVAAKKKYPMADNRPPLRYQRVPPASQEYGSSLIANLKELLARSGLQECVQFYGSHFYGAPDGVAEGLMTEELLV
jgi:hypothetical protein